MTIGQITISAADWMATRLEERMALLSAAPPPPGLDDPPASRIKASDSLGTDNNDRRDRDRALLAAQESYKRVAQRIKARLASALPERTSDAPQQSRMDTAPARAQTEDAGKRPDGRTTDSDQADSFAARTRALADPRSQNEAQAEDSDTTRKGLWNDLFVDRLGSDTTSETRQPR